MSIDNNYYLSIKVDTTGELQSFAVPEEVYVYIQQLEGFINNPEHSNLLKLYPERFNSVHTPLSSETAKSFIINGCKYSSVLEYISYSDIIRLAYPTRVHTKDIVYTVIYCHETINGCLTFSKSVKLLDGMIFNIGITNNS